MQLNAYTFDFQGQSYSVSFSNENWYNSKISYVELPDRKILKVIAWLDNPLRPELRETLMLPDGVSYLSAQINN